jgi:hypothetical protein
MADNGTPTPIPPVNDDALRMGTFDLPPAQIEALRGRLVDGIVKSIAGMSTFRIQEVARFIEICENDHGCITPAEEFITSLVADHFRDG